MASTSLTLSMLPARRLPSGSGRVLLTSGTGVGAFFELGKAHADGFVERLLEALTMLGPVPFQPDSQVVIKGDRRPHSI